MLILAGLGNPGPAYSRHRHNVGFLILDRLAEKHGLSPWRSRFQAQCAEGTIGGHKVLAMKPQTYMNESGRAVGEAMRFFKLTPQDVAVIHDEIDLAEGKLRVKTGGGAAGNNGIRSITAHIGPDFRRVRVGVGHPGVKEAVHQWVLSDFAKADEAWLTPLIDAIAEAAPELAAGNDVNFASRVALILNPRPKKEKPATGPEQKDKGDGI